MLAPTTCPYGCGAHMLKKDVKFHTTYMCKEIVQEPPEWQNHHVKVRRAEMAAEGEKQRVESLCPMGCEMMIQKKNLEHHMKHECDFRLGRCRNPGCEALIPMNRLEAHEKFFCESPYAAARNEMVAKAREKAGYPMPWLLRQKAAEDGVGGGGAGAGAGAGAEEAVESKFAVGKGAVSVDISGPVDTSKPFD